ncbi:CapA family protein [candidate division KSB1 bacterium]|nr:CapA family protein [candidate division KSB1 bacterium]
MKLKKNSRIRRARLFLAGIAWALPAIFILKLNAQQDLGDTTPWHPVRRMITEEKPVWLTPTAEPIITIAAVGDLMMSSWIIDVVQEKGVDFPFDSTRHFIQSAEVAIANLEAPLTTKGERFADKKYTFKVPPHFVAGIARAGFDIVTMANNHIADFGCEGILNTVAALQEAGIHHCGAGRNIDEACAPTILDVNGVKVAFLGFSMTYPDDFWATRTRCGTCYPTEQLLYERVTQAERLADLTIVSFHWGAEKHNEPRAYQMSYGRHAIDCGADLVLGHHPHVLQGVELYRGKLIAYSLGNYVFASYSGSSRTSMVLRAKIAPNGLLLAKIIPINVHNASINFQPVAFSGEMKKRVLEELNDYSRPLNSGKRIIDDDGYILPSKFIM